MKKQKHLFQKFQKKYLFFQKSFFDFLYWRSTKSLNPQSISVKQLNSFKRFYPLEQEKICFYEYWKSSENQKIQNTFKNSTKGFQKNPKSFYSMSSFSNSNFVYDRPKEKSFLPFRGQKNKKKTNSSFTSKSVHFSTSQKFHVLFLKNRKEKFTNIKSKNSKTESFLPKNSSFEISQNLNFFESQKIGEFFPKKKNFIHYWIFPFLGVLFFFSQNSSVLFKEKNESFFSLKPLQFIDRESLSDLKQPNEVFEKRQFFLFKKSEQNQTQPDPNKGNFSFAQKNPTEILFFQNLEKNEYEDFLKFYTKILKTNLSSFPLIENKNFFCSMQGQSEEKMYLTKTFLLQNHFQKQLESKRNCLNWKWFSLNSNFLNPKTMISISSTFQIPQKAEFFIKNPLSFIENPASLNENIFPQEVHEALVFDLPNKEIKNQIFITHDLNHWVNEKKNFSTPLFDYSKSLFLVDELKRNFSFLNAYDIFSSGFPKISELDLKSQKVHFPYLLKNYEMQKFFHPSIHTPAQSFFVAMQKSGATQNEFSFGLKQKEESFSNFLGQTSTNSFVFNNENNNKNNSFEKNLFFLNKWAKTHKSSLLVKVHQKQIPLNKYFHLNMNENSSFYKNEIDQKHEKEFKGNFQKLHSLDSLYLQKLFKNFQNRKFQKKFEVQSVLTGQKNGPFFATQKSRAKKFQNFLNFRKQTFDFFTFDYYNQNYKKYLNSLWYKSEKSKKLPLLFKKFKKKTPLFSKFKTKPRNIKFFQSIPHISFFLKSQKIPGKKTHHFNFFLKNQKESKFTLTKEKNLSFIEKIVFDSSFSKKHIFKNTLIFHFNNPILFQFSPKEEISEKLYTKNFMNVLKQKSFFSPLKENFIDFLRDDQKLELQSNLTVYPQNFYQQNLCSSLFPLFKQKNDFTFQLGKFNFFQNFRPRSDEKLSKNFFHQSQKHGRSGAEKSLFSNIYKFETFQKSFLFETSQFQKALFFHLPPPSPHLHPSIQLDKVLAEKQRSGPLFCSSSTLWRSGAKKSGEVEQKDISEKEKTSMSSQFFVLKSKKKLSFIEYQKQKKKVDSSFWGFSKKQRKFEKVFRTFFSPLKDAKNSFLFGVEKKEKFFGKKTKKDTIFLHNLSILLKQNPQISSFKFFIPTTCFADEKFFFENTQKEYRTFFHHRADKKQNENLESFQSEFQRSSRLSPEFVLKRDGFLFISSTKEKKTSSFQRLEKEKIFQKKRRLKKEKLETRRRKKRKRFFPRPLWLRMNLYKKFLKTRHPYVKQNNSPLRSALSISKTHSSLLKINKLNFENHSLFLSFNEKFVQKKGKWFKKMEQKQLNAYFLKRFQNKTNFLETSSNSQIYDVYSLFFKKQNSTFQSKTYQKNHQRDNWKNENRTSKKSFYSNFGSIGEKNFFQENKENIDISKNILHYKISDEIFQEFLRLSWKSSWFQNNFKPYTQAIQKNFQQIQSIESEKNFNNFFDFLPIQGSQNTIKNKNFGFFFHNFPVFSEQSQNDFLVRKSVLQKFSWYSNIHSFLPRNESNSLTLHHGAEGKINSENFYSVLSTEKTRVNIPEYNRILYARISEVLKKFKFSENMTNESFFENFKVQRRKNEKIFSESNNSFFTKTALLFEKFQVPSKPVIPAFSVFSSLFNDFSIKPTGDIPTLRAMWAFQKTNYSHFEERNAVQNLWAFKKQKDNFNSFKGTKKIMNFLRKYNGFEKFKIPKQFSSDLFLLSKKGEFFHPLDTMTLKKFQNIEKKSSMFGVQSLKQNSKISYRYFKFHLSPFFQNPNKFSFALNQKKKQEIFSLFSPKDLKNKNIQNSAKSSLNFWWAQQQPFQIFDFFGTSQFQTFHKISNKKAILFDKNEFLLNIFSEKFVSPLCVPQTGNREQKNDKFFFSNFSFFTDFPVQGGLFVFGAFFFHFAIFYTLFKIPEIRSVFKFTLLIFSKFWKSFFLVFFSIYNIFKRYTKNGLNLFKNSSSFTEKKTVEYKSLFQWNTSQSLEIAQSSLVFLLRSAVSKKKQQELYSSLKEQSLNLFPAVSEFKNFHQHSGKNHKKSFFFNFVEKKQKNQNKIKFDNFVFEFFPRLSSFTLGEKKFFQNFILESHPFIQEKKESIHNMKLRGSNPAQINIRRKSFSKKEKTPVFLLKFSINSFSNFQFVRGAGQNKTYFFVPLQMSSLKTEKSFVQLSKTEKNLSQFALSFLVFGKYILLVPYSIFKLGSSFFTKIFEIVENIFYAFYKFLEKPAEFMIEFIAFVFLIEWSSDIIGFFPDSIESSLWKSSQKLLRPVRTGTFFLSFGLFFVGTSAKNFSKGSQLVFQTGQNFSFFSPFHFLLSTGFFNFSNFVSYVFQKRLFYIFERFPSILLQPDIDILVRQRKGIIFWDIWAEILLKAAEKYNVNLPSFVTLKEEQELFIEKLVRDSQFFENIHVPNSNKIQKADFRFPFLHEAGDLDFVSAGKMKFQKNQSLMNETKIEKTNSLQNFSAFLQNFVIQNQPLSLFDFYYSPLRGPQEEGLFNFSFILQKSKNAKLQQFPISNLFHSSFLSQSSSFFKPFQQHLILHQLLMNENMAVNNKEKLKKLFLKNVSNIQNVDFSPLFEKRKNEKFFTFFPFFENSRSLQDLQKVSKQENLSTFQNFTLLRNKLDQWQFNQYATFQSQETDFFLDIYPPKSLKHVHFLKYYEPAHYTLGSLICQIYAGIFSKQISKNILVIGEPGTAKTFFLRALAGETEMKIITENASRYAVVQRGVAVGMKYLRDVFDAIALQTPCFFVMEDLHVIGSKRPFMISENENTQNIQSSFGLEQQEVHETNQMIYQSSRHSLSDFRRPYKGDFSMGIPTNFFLQTFYSPFFSKSRNTNKNSSSSRHKENLNGGDSFFYPIQKGNQFQNSQFFGGNFSSNVWHSLSSPLPIDSLDALFQKSGSDSFQQGEDKGIAFESFSSKKNIKQIQSCLQFSKEQIFAPPATSPFTVLMMKEQKKIKPKKIVQETSWGGLSADQILLYQKENSSIRAKVAVFAEKTMNLSRGKFDMITDFLVILDSVRSNRGFVVFGTTHKPSSLDPALRRPGRFDETLSLARNPNFLNRFEIFKMNFENSVSTFDFFDSSILTENFSEMDLFDILSQTKLSFLHNYKYVFQKALPDQLKNFQKNATKVQNHENLLGKKQLYSQTSPIKAFHVLLKSPIFEDFYTQKQFTLLSSKQKVLPQNFSFSLRNSNLLSPIHGPQKYTLLPNGPSHILSLAYSKLGTFLAEATLLNNPISYVPLNLDIEKNSSKHSNFIQFYGNVFYDSKKQRDLQLMVFLSAKITEFLSQKNLSFVLPKMVERTFITQNSFGNDFPKEILIFEKPQYFFYTKFGVFESSFQNFEKSKNKKYKKNFFSTKVNFSHETSQKNPSFHSVCGAFQKSEFLLPGQSSGGQKDFYWTVYGNEESWRSATPFLFSLIQKRFLFTKNLLLSKMLFFENMDQRRKPPSPPGSSILMPAKKYENFKRTETDFFQKSHFSIHEKIQMHQKQRFLKQLYNIPIQKYFRSELRKNHKTLFSSSFQEFAYLDSVVEKTSSVHSYYRKYIQVRHRFSNINLWWNGMFPEHTRETTYLSDVDWRTMFVSSAEKGHSGNNVDRKIEEGRKIHLQKNESGLQEGSKKLSNETFEFLMDFPDAEQYYNPRNRRWFFKSKEHFSTSSNFWAIFEKDLQYEIFSHFLMESFYQSFSYFDKKREMLDFFVFHFLYKGFLKEFDFLTTFSRF